LNEKLLGIRIVLQARFDLLVKLVELLVGFLERNIGALVQGKLILGVVVALVLSKCESRHGQNHGSGEYRGFHRSSSV
jgi:hypothetical protein